MEHWHSLNSTGDRESIKRQRHATLAFLKIDLRHQDPRQGPHVCPTKEFPGYSWPDAQRLVGGSIKGPTVEGHYWDLRGEMSLVREVVQILQSMLN